MSQRWLLFCIFAIAIGLRLAGLGQLPPGLTHDEADHGMSAWGVLQGIRPIYFSVGYGREPFYDYATAGLMTILGPKALAPRLTSFFCSVILLALTYRWVMLAFGRSVALLTISGYAVNFWAVMTARHALRTLTMPLLFGAGLLIWWPLLRPTRPIPLTQQLLRALLSGLCWGVMFYTYMPARLIWVVPLIIATLPLLASKNQRRHPLLLTLCSLLIALAIAYPLIRYLQLSGAEARIAQLRDPIDAALQGNFRPILTNSLQTLQLFTLHGDDGTIIWRYNLPGQPFLRSIEGLLFYFGLLLAVVALLRQQNRLAYATALLWLIVGLSPSLITGPEAATTRAIALQPILTLFPALALTQLARTFGRIPLQTPILLTWLIVGGALTHRDYFVLWGQNPNVRVQYETALVEAMHYLDAHPVPSAAISTNEPNRHHDPATAFLTQNDPTIALGWFDGRQSLLLPQGQTTIALLGNAPLHQALQFLLPRAPTATLPLRSNDQDRPITFYDLTDYAPPPLEHLLKQPVRFGNNAQLQGYQFEQSAETLTLITQWQIEQPHPELRLFVHLRQSAENPTPIAQADRLDVPSYYWRAGDQFWQYHHLTLPPFIGTHQLIIGLYDPASGQRLPTSAELDYYTLTTITPPP